MPDTKNLLSIIRLDKSFPLAKTSLFQKQRPMLLANEEISIDIRKGETFGLVGESGCGKSTFGRTLLQLHRPTAGEVLYFGKTLFDFKPKYLKAVLNNSMQDYTATRQEKGEELSEKARKSARIFGGFLALDKEDFLEAAKLLKEYYFPQNNNSSRTWYGCADKNKAIMDSLQALKAKAKQQKKFSVFEKEISEGIDLTRLTPNELRALRKDLQIIFQDPYSSLNPRMTVGQIIEEGVATHKYYKKGSSEMDKYIQGIMESCGLQGYMRHRYPHQFSGGQRQRVCIARALAVKPQFVVCDECVSALDVSVQSQILNLLTELKEKEGLTYLFISHDLSVVRYVSDRIGVMYLGKIVELGEAEKIFSNPRHPYTIALISAIPRLTEGENVEKILLEGHMPSPVTPPSGCRFHTRCFMAQDCCKRIPAPIVTVEEGHFAACHFAQISTQEKQNLAKGATKN